MTPVRERKPAWLKVVAPGGEGYARVKGTLASLDLHTVCQEARCPNVGECWGEGTATLMLLGDTCTRGCRFCAVTSGHPGEVDAGEPGAVADAVKRLGLRYVVLTMVNRDDLPDGGAGHVAATIRRLHDAAPGLLVEALVGDFGGRVADIHRVVDAQPEVFGHNIEVVERLTRALRDARCSYAGSLEVLRQAKQRAPERFVKSSVMVGVGETDDEVLQAMRDLRAAGVDIVTIGQYLRPSGKHAPVDRYVDPSVFEAYREQAMGLGFEYVASGPLVRSSYRAAEAFVRARAAG